MTKAGQRLAAWRRRKRWSQARAARAVDVSQTAWSSWEVGARVPGREAAVAIERLTGIAVASWPATGTGATA